MCTVSFVRSGNKTIITSNRDEQPARPALPPQKYEINGRTVLFPKDAQSGGTWYAMTETGTVLVLLNGAAEKHHHNPPYRKSRGIVVLDIVSAGSPLAFWKDIDLEKIEPFTLVLFEKEKLYQLRWNETEKETTALDASQNHIWSSSTLYPEAIRKERAAWFRTFLNTKPNVSEQEMYHFHRYTEGEDSENGLVIDRNGLLKTLSITQTVIEGGKVVLSHYDLLGQQQYNNSFSTI